MRNWISGSICLVIVAWFGIAFAQQSFYSIHIVSHKQQSQADAEVKSLRSRGLDAFVRRVQVEGKGMWYRIYVGRYATQKEATDDIDRLRQMKVSQYFAVRKLSEEKPKAAAAGAAAKQPPAASTARPPAPTSANYYLFVGFYRDLDPAQQEVKRLGTALAPYGYRVLLTRETKTDGMIYRVYIGTYGDQQQAAASGAQLKEKKILTAFYIPVGTTQDMITGTMPAAAAETAAAPSDSASAEAQQPAAKAADEKPAVAKTPAAADDFNRVALMLKGGAYLPQNVDEFVVTSGATTYRISDDAAPQFGLEALVRFNKVIGLYASADAVFISDIDWYNFAAGPVLTIPAGKSVVPYVKGGAVYGDFSWDAPGEFDSAFGWEAAAGVHFLQSNVKLGIEFAYRDLSFDYSDPSAVASQESLDMAGFSLMATLSFWF